MGSVGYIYAYVYVKVMIKENKVMNLKGSWWQKKN